MKLTPTATVPSPDVSALSAKDGPNVVAVRTCSPVLRIQLDRRNSLDDAPRGAVPTSNWVARPSALPTFGAPAGVVIWVMVPPTVDSGTVVVTPLIGAGVVWAAAGVP